MAVLSREVTAADRKVRVRELTVAEVRQWLADLESGTLFGEGVDLVGETLLDGLSLAELARFTDLAHDEADRCTQAELEALARAVRELNPGFFRVRAAVTKAASATPPAPSTPG